MSKNAIASASMLYQETIQALGPLAGIIVSKLTEGQNLGYNFIVNALQSQLSKWAGITLENFFGNFDVLGWIKALDQTKFFDALSGLSAEFTLADLLVADIDQGIDLQFTDRNYCRHRSVKSTNEIEAGEQHCKCCSMITTGDYCKACAPIDLSTLTYKSTFEPVEKGRSFNKKEERDGQSSKQKAEKEKPMTIRTKTGEAVKKKPSQTPTKYSDATKLDDFTP